MNPDSVPCQFYAFIRVFVPEVVPFIFDALKWIHGGTPIVVVVVVVVLAFERFLVGLAEWNKQECCSSCVDEMLSTLRTHFQRAQSALTVLSNRQLP